jgi:hypothetical protein
VDMAAPHRRGPLAIFRSEDFGSKGGDRRTYSLRRNGPPFEPVDDKIDKTEQFAEL